MKTLKMEVCMLPPGGGKIKIKRTFTGHFPGLVWHIFSGSVEASFHEWKIRTEWFWEIMNRDLSFYEWKIKNKWKVWTEWFWGYLKKSVALERHVLESEIRIVLLIFLNLAVIGWIFNQGVFVVKLPYNYAFGEEIIDAKLPIIPNGNPDLAGITRLDSERKNNDEKSEEEDNKMIITELNKLISSQDERCEKDKNDKKCTELCVKNEEEIIAQMKEEERQAWKKYLSSKPKLLGPRPSAHISCDKDTKGARKSPNKGKHMDEDCCPDPDEWPKPGCRYSAAGLGLMMKGPRK